MALFANRVQAGQQLAEALQRFSFKDGLVLAIPRGGVVVGYEIADSLNLLLDVIVPRKLGAPGNPEYAIGAVAEDGTMILDENVLEYLHVPQDYIEWESATQKQEIQRRMRLYRQDTPYPDLKGRDVVVVDDGIATGSTMKAALTSVKNCGANTVTAAIPVGPPSTIEVLKKLADRVVCLFTPESFFAIGEFYDDFSQTSDDEVIYLLGKNREKHVLESVSR